MKKKIKTINATFGETLNNYLDRVSYYQSMYPDANIVGKFNQISFSCSQGNSVYDAYREAKDLFLNSVPDKIKENRKKAIVDIENKLSTMIKVANKNGGKLSEDQIMTGLGTAAYNAFELKPEDKLNSDLCKKIVNILENSGYTMCPKEKAYRGGMNPKSGEVWLVIDQSHICASKDNIPTTDNDSYIKYAIETAMTHLSECTLEVAMYSFFYIYNDKKREQQHNEK